MTDKRLGRGLSALIPTDDKRLEEIEIEKIIPNSSQPRELINDEGIKELAESIREKGILQPILVRRRDDKYEIVAGERRYLSAKLVGLDKVPAIILDIDEREAFEISLIENIQREDLNPIEKAEAFQSYIDRYKVTHEELAKRLGISRTEITNLLRLLQLPPEIKEEVKKDSLTYGHARALLGLKDAESQKEMAKRIVKEKLSVRETEELVGKRKMRLEIPEIRALESKLQSYLETKVRIHPRSPERGRITIEYKSLEELERIIGKFLE